MKNPAGSQYDYGYVNSSYRRSGCLVEIPNHPKNLGSNLQPLNLKTMFGSFLKNKPEKVTTDVRTVTL